MPDSHISSYVFVLNYNDLNLTEFCLYSGTGLLTSKLNGILYVCYCEKVYPDQNKKRKPHINLANFGAIPYRQEAI